MNYDRNSSGPNELYIDGAQEASANSSASWTFGENKYPLELGHHPSFWAAYVGELAEVGHWMGSTKLSADEIAALAKAFQPPRVRLSGMSLYAPLVREARSLQGHAMTVVGTTVSDHPRVIGGMI